MAPLGLFEEGILEEEEAVMNPDDYNDWNGHQPTIDLIQDMRDQQPQLEEEGAPDNGHQVTTDLIQDIVGDQQPQLQRNEQLSGAAEMPSLIDSTELSTVDETISAVPTSSSSNEEDLLDMMRGAAASDDEGDEGDNNNAATSILNSNNNNDNDGVLDHILSSHLAENINLLDANDFDDESSESSDKLALKVLKQVFRILSQRGGAVSTCGTTLDEANFDPHERVVILLYGAPDQPQLIVAYRNQAVRPSSIETSIPKFNDSESAVIIDDGDDGCIVSRYDTHPDSSPMWSVRLYSMVVPPSSSFALAEVSPEPSPPTPLIQPPPLTQPPSSVSPRGGGDGGGGEGGGERASLVRLRSGELKAEGSRAEKLEFIRTMVHEVFVEPGEDLGDFDAFWLSLLLLSEEEEEEEQQEQEDPELPLRKRVTKGCYRGGARRGATRGGGGGGKSPVTQDQKAVETSELIDNCLELFSKHYGNKIKSSEQESLINILKLLKKRKLLQQQQQDNVIDGLTQHMKNNFHIDE